MPPCGGIPLQSSWTYLGQTTKTIEGLCLPFVLGMPQDPPRRAKRAWGWLCLYCDHQCWYFCTKNTKAMDQLSILLLICFLWRTYQWINHSFNTVSVTQVSVMASQRSGSHGRKLYSPKLLVWIKWLSIWPKVNKVKFFFLFYVSLASGKSLGIWQSRSGVCAVTLPSCKRKHSLHWKMCLIRSQGW